jgi:hypothetical protein
MVDVSWAALRQSAFQSTRCTKNPVQVKSLVFLLLYSLTVGGGGHIQYGILNVNTVLYSICALCIWESNHLHITEKDVKGLA